jgi:hypothetical protein
MGISPTPRPSRSGDSDVMDTITQTRVGIGELGGLITWATGLGLLLVGAMAENPGAIAGGSALPCYLLGTLAMFIGLCWSLATMAVAATRLSDQTSRTAVTTLWLNGTSWFGTALVIGTAWALNVS